MKKFLRVLCMVLVLSMLLTPLCFAEDNYDTLADWDLKVKVPEGKTAVLKGNQYYIYGQRTGEIPYVMIMAYHYESEEKFITDFTASMQRSYADLKVTKEAARVTIGAVAQNKLQGTLIQVLIWSYIDFIFRCGIIYEWSKISSVGLL